ncbi:MAG: glycerate kinase [Anaerolineaceae bacterium]|nr:glycerate kinase [Anaerolineaceae bacterium]
MKKIIVAADSFKGSLSASQACGIIAAQARQIFPRAQVLEMPVSDGGEGLVEALISTLEGELVWVDTQDPLRRPLRASYAMMTDGTALIEMAGAGGFTLLRPQERDPLQTSSYGVGLLIMDAIKRKADPIYIGLGGSATVDGGIGAAAALGIRFFNEQDQALTNGAGLQRINGLDLHGLRQLHYPGRLVFLNDVHNPLCGSNGAAAVFGPQKGATAQQVKELDQGLENLADLVARETGLQLKETVGIGAAGGFALPFVAFMGAEIHSGIDFVLDLLEFDHKLAGSDLVITGEGRTDAQSVMGKAISAVATRARAARVRVAVISGEIGEGAEGMAALGVDDLVQATPEGQSLEEALSQAAGNLAIAANKYLHGLKDQYCQDQPLL